MPNPPQYQPISQDDKHDQYEPRTSSDSLPPTYPPPASGSSSSGSGSGTHVIYTFEPRFPHLDLGDRQDMLGVLGSDPAETTRIVQRAFPKLQRFPIEFLAPIEIDSNGKVADDRWAPIMDEAWSRFSDTSRAPTRIKVQIVDQEGDAEDREKYLKAKKNKNDRIVIAFIVAPIVIFSLAMAGFALFGAFATDD